MTDKPTPTDAELKAMWQLHAADIGGILDFARAVLAKWGQPAQAGEPVAVVVPCYTPSGKRVALYSAKQDLPIGTQLYTAPQPTQPKPVAREQLTRERVKEIVRGAGYDQCGIPDTERAAFINGLRHGEQAHGIKGGQHGADK